MTTYLKQSTAVDIALGPFLDSVDGNSVEAALTITQPDIRLKKNAAAWAQKSAAQTLSHEEAGWYEANLSATDTDTLGVLMVAVHEAGALPVWREFSVVPANVYDSLFSTDKLQVDVVECTGAAQATIATQASVTAIDDFIDTEVSAILVAVDTEVAAIKAKTDLIPASPSAVSDVPTLAAITAGVWDLANGIEVGLTPRGSMRLMAAALCGKISGAGSATETVRNAVADSLNRLIYQTDSSGNRTGITYVVT